MQTRVAIKNIVYYPEAQENITYTIQSRVTLDASESGGSAEELQSWNNIATLIHAPPQSPAFPYSDYTNYSTIPDFVRVEYRVIDESKRIGINRWFNTVPITDLQNEKGFGPLPTNVTYALHFNQLVETINLLDTARLELPLLLQSETTTTTKVGPLEATGFGAPDGADETLQTMGTSWGDQPEMFNYRYSFGSVSTFSTESTGWNDYNVTTMSSSRDHNIASAIYLVRDGVVYQIEQEVDSITNWRIKAEQPAYYAIPDELRATLAEGGAGMFGWYQESESWVTNTDFETEVVYAPYEGHPSYEGVTTTSISRNTCVFSAGMTITPPALTDGPMLSYYRHGGSNGDGSAEYGSETAASFLPVTGNIGSISVVVPPDYYSFP